MLKFYDYRCGSCGRVKEFFLESGTDPETRCDCGAVEWTRCMPGPASTLKVGSRYIPPVRPKAKP